MLLQGNNITQVKGDTQILSNVSFQAREGSIFLIFGPSGCGKTTLLRIINGLDEMTSGDIILGGQSIHDVHQLIWRKECPLIFQEPRLFDGTVEYNIRFAAEYHQIPVVVEQLLEAVELEGFAGKDVSTLSGGQKQRVSIARALALQPKVLLMDEPTASLDDDAKLVIEDLIKSLVQKRGVTAVLVSHDIDQVERMAQSSIVLDRGKVVFDGSIQQYLDEKAAFNSR
ncbi:MAG: ABC transporter ATP-binding protein [Candidatus Hodarchaeales archaeon]|jgi:putative ABC transport system ATP-binding protein